MPSLDRWRAAMDGYESGIVSAKMVAIGARGVSVAIYLNRVHLRVHPWFVDRFLLSLEKSPKDDPLNGAALVTRIEIAIAPDGRIVQMGVVTPSGVPAFDASGLEVFSRAAPFEPTPEEIRSSDGNVWIHWDLHRNEVYACSTMKSRPFIVEF